MAQSPKRRYATKRAATGYANDCTHEDQKVCWNQGTWDGEYFLCECQKSEEGGFCFFQGVSQHHETCKPEVTRSAEVWLDPQSGYGDTDDVIDWEWSVLGWLFVGTMDLEKIAEDRRSQTQQTGDIIIVHNFMNYTIHENVYMYSPGQDLLHIVITFGDSPVDPDKTHLKIYINNVTVIDIPEFKYSIDYYIGEDAEIVGVGVNAIHE